MQIPPRLKKIIKPFAEQVGFYWPVYREKRALQKARMGVAVRLRARPGRLAILGCGAMGSTIARSVHHLPGWSVGPLFDMMREAAERLSRSFPGSAVAEDERAFFDAARTADVLAIATTADTHLSSTLRAMELGVRTILLEKPVATSLADADAVIEAADRTGARVAVDHTRRWLPSGEGLRRLVGGVLGPPRAIHFVYGRAGFAMIGTHLFDLARWLIGSDIAVLRAELDADAGVNKRGERFVDPPGYCEGRFVNGVRLTMDLSSDLHLRQRAFVVVCELGRLEVDERLGRVRLVGTGGRAWEAEYVSPDVLELGVAAALHELQSGSPPRATLADGRAALEAAIACQVSSREGGRWVDLPLAGDVCEERFAFA